MYIYIIRNRKYFQDIRTNIDSQYFYSDGILAARHLVSYFMNHPEDKKC